MDDESSSLAAVFSGNTSAGEYTVHSLFLKTAVLIFALRVLLTLLSKAADSQQLLTVAWSTLFCFVLKIHPNFLYAMGKKRVKQM